MLSPIRPIQSTEVRRVDEVSPLRNVGDRASAALVETADGVRITIGADAKRLARDGGNPRDSSRSQAVEPRSVPNAGGDEAGGATLPTFESATPQPVVFTSTAAVASASTQSSALANRALRALSNDAGVASDATPSEDPNDVIWDPHQSSKVPYEVLQRAVAQATAPTDSAAAPAEGNPATPIEPLFLPLENGGKPFGRAVPFELSGKEPLPIGGSDASPAPTPRPLTSQQADALLSDLSWSLPGRAPASASASL